MSNLFKIRKGLVVNTNDLYVSGGDVGIGTTTLTDQKLTVQGGISGSALDVAGQSTFRNVLQSPSYQSGFAGSGWQINSSANAEFEDLTVRGTMRIYELLINQIRATNGSLFVSSVGRVDSVEDLGGGNFALTFDTGSGDIAHGFIAGDVIRAQRVNLNSLDELSPGDRETPEDEEGYLIYRSDMTVSSVQSLTVITASLSQSSTPPSSSYEFVRLGNTTDDTRQGNIYLTSDDNYAPFIDVVDGITSHADWNSSTSNGGVKVRVGKLDGITSNVFGGALSGYGMWASGSAYLEGGINATTGSIGGVKIQSGKIFTGAGTWGTSGTGFYLDSAGSMSLKDKLTWNGTLLSIDGKITAGSGKIGGFEITTTSITSSNDDLVLKSAGEITGSKVLFTGGKISGSGLSIDVTTLTAKGDSVEISGSNFHLVNGNITASNVDLSGKITAQTGNIGGWSVNSNNINKDDVFLSTGTNSTGLFITGSGGNNLLQVGEFNTYTPSPTTGIATGSRSSTSTISAVTSYNNHSQFALICNQTISAGLNSASIFIPIDTTLEPGEFVSVKQEVDFLSKTFSELNLDSVNGGQSVEMTIVKTSDKTPVSETVRIENPEYSNPALNPKSGELNLFYRNDSNSTQKAAEYYSVEITYKYNFVKSATNCDTGTVKTLVTVPPVEIEKDYSVINITRDQALFYAGGGSKFEWTPSGINLDLIDTSFTKVTTQEVVVDSPYGNIAAFTAKDKDNDGLLIGVADNGDPYLAPISNNVYGFEREIRYDQANQRWSIEGDLNVTGDVNLTGDITGHPDITGAADDVTGTGNEFIQSLDFDEYGHVVGVTTASASPVIESFSKINNSSGTQQFTADGAEAALQFAGGGATTVSFDSGNKRITFTSTDTNTTYTAGSGLTLSGTQFSVNDTVVRTSGDQTIAGNKTFTGTTVIGDSIDQIHKMNGNLLVNISGLIPDVVTGGSGKQFIFNGDGTFPILSTTYSGSNNGGWVTHIASSTDGYVGFPKTGRLIFIGSTNAGGEGPSTVMQISGSGQVDVTGDLIVSGTLTAQEFKTEYITQTVIFESGSTQFGNSSDDTHTFSGSIRQWDGNVDSYFLGGLSVGTSTNTSKLTVAGAVAATSANLSSGDLYLGDALIRVSGSTYNGGDPGSITYTVAKISKDNYDGFFFDYVIRKNVTGGGAAGDRYGRTGTIMAFYSGSEVNFTDTSTAWFGDAGQESNVDLYVEVVGTDIELKADVQYSNWKIKAIARGI